MCSLCGQAVLAPTVFAALPSRLPSLSTMGCVMRLNTVERLANNPLRAAHQHRREAQWFR